jgi:hypothetical protein
MTRSDLPFPLYAWQLRDNRGEDAVFAREQMERIRQLEDQLLTLDKEKIEPLAEMLK